MSVAPFPLAPGPRARTWAGALLLVLALLLAPFAAPPAEAAAPPVAAASCEGGEHQDAPEAALRLPTGHPTRLPAAPPPRAFPRAARLGATPAEHPARLSHRALRTVVLRC